MILFFPATDCHIGFLEKDLIRGQDSFKTFEEVLKQAVEYDVSFHFSCHIFRHSQRNCHFNFIIYSGVFQAQMVLIDYVEGS